MGDRSPEPVHGDPPEAVLVQAQAASGVALALGEDPRALVRLTLHLRRNRGHDPDDHYTAELGVDPDTAREIGRHLIAAAKAARADLARYLDQGDPR